MDELFYDWNMRLSEYQHLLIHDAGFRTYAEVKAASDADLLQIRGVGPKTLWVIRDAIKIREHQLLNTG